MYPPSTIGGDPNRELRWSKRIDQRSKRFESAQITAGFTVVRQGMEKAGPVRAANLKKYF